MSVLNFKAGCQDVLVWRKMVNKPAAIGISTFIPQGKSKKKKMLIVEIAIVVFLATQISSVIGQC